MSAGATTVLLPSRPTPDAVAELLKKHQVTVFYAVPSCSSPARSRNCRMASLPNTHHPLEL